MLMRESGKNTENDVCTYLLRFQIRVDCRLGDFKHLNLRKGFNVDMKHDYRKRATNRTEVYTQTHKTCWDIKSTQAAKSV